MTNLLSKSNCILFSFFYNHIILLRTQSLSFKIPIAFTRYDLHFVKVFSVHAVACIHSAGNRHYANQQLINKNATRVNFCDFVTRGTSWFKDDKIIL